MILDIFINVRFISMMKIFVYIILRIVDLRNVTDKRVVKMMIVFNKDDISLEKI